MKFLSFKVRPFIWVGSGLSFLSLMLFGAVASCGGPAARADAASLGSLIVVPVLSLFLVVRLFAWLCTGCQIDTAKWRARLAPVKALFKRPTKPMIVPDFNSLEYPDVSIVEDVAATEHKELALTR